MLKNKNKQYKQVQIEKELYRKIRALSFNNEIDMRVIASAIVNYVVADPKKVEEIIQKLKMN